VNFLRVSESADITASSIAPCCGQHIVTMQVAKTSSTALSQKVNSKRLWELARFVVTAVCCGCGDWTCDCLREC
jgi:hypothetical protein